VQDDQFVLWKLYVLPDHHGRGIGSQLMEAVVERAVELGHTSVSLSYTDGNTYAHRFYRAHGFTESHRESSGSGLPDSVWVTRDISDVTPTPQSSAEPDPEDQS
jgi:ribosomal protein S18 acetylase RimI-like enzyme